MGTLLRSVIRAGTYSVIRRLGLAKTIAVGIVALVSLWVLTGDAMAATYATTCPTPPGTDVACEAIAERLETLVAELEQKPETDLEHDYSAVLDSIDESTSISALQYGGSSEISGTVQLSEADRNRSDLQWWGVWALVGLTLALLIAPRFSNLLDPTRGL